MNKKFKDPFGGVHGEEAGNSPSPFKIDKEEALREIKDSLDKWDQKKVVKKLPMGRLGEKEEFANFVSYLTSDNCNWLTGQVINFDGGEVVGNSGEFNILNSLSSTEWEIIKKLR